MEKEEEEEEKKPQVFNKTQPIKMCWYIIRLKLKCLRMVIITNHNHKLEYKKTPSLVHIKYFNDIV